MYEQFQISKAKRRKDYFVPRSARHKAEESLALGLARLDRLTFMFCCR